MSAADKVVVLSGGGTAGHVLPALAIGRAAVGLGVPTDHVRFVGSASGMEAALVPAAGFTLEALPLRNFRRRLHPRTVVAVAQLFLATWRARRVLGRWKASVVVSVGGYASVPAVVAARLRRIPVVVVSYDARPGLANRWSARLARATAVAFAPTELPRAVVTGAPVRAEVASIDRRRDRASARAALGVEEQRFLIVAFGGSLGSGKINDVIDGFVAAHRGRRDLAVRHVVGARNANASRPELDGSDGIQYQPVAFDHHMERCLAACDLLVARAGASTVGEVGAAGVPAVLVPWPDAAEDHQRANARSLSDQGGALMVDEADFDAGWLAERIAEFQRAPHLLDELGARAAAAGRADGAEQIARLALEVAGGA